jgi:hypothetical protein
MSGPRQNTQRKLARVPGEKGETLIAGDLGAEPVTAETEPESSAATLRVEAQPGRTAEVRDPYARWCGRGGAARASPYPDLWHSPSVGPCSQGRIAPKGDVYAKGGK